MSELPRAWKVVRIADLLELNENKKPFQQGWSPLCESRPAEDDEWGVLKTTAIQQGEFWQHENKALPTHLEPRTNIEIKAGDILMTCAGPRNRCGVVSFVKSTRPRLMMSGKMYRFRPNSKILNSRYLEAFIMSSDAQRAIDEMKTGINDSGLNLTHGRFAELKVPVPPLNVQGKIVDKIEQAFSELDKGIESLKTAREQLKVYRQAVLKHAFEGKLTAHWREQNKDKLESPEQLLARIQQEREARYQQQLQGWKTAVKSWEKSGKEGKKPGKPKSYENIVLPNAEEVDLLPEIPNGWAWLRLSQLSEISGGLTKNQKRNAMARRMKYLRVANVYADRLLLDDIQEIGVTEDEAKKVLLKAGDILVVEGNGSVEQIGRVALWDGSVEDCGHQNHLIRVRLSGFIDSRVVLLFLLSPLGREFIVKEASSTSGLHTLSISKVGNLMVPVMSEHEACELVKQVDTQISNIEKLKAEIRDQLIRSETLRQSILKEAFSGQLVANYGKAEFTAKKKKNQAQD